MFAPEFLAHNAFYGHDLSYPETAVIANDLPLHASMEDGYFNPVTDYDYYGHGDLDFYGGVHDFGMYGAPAYGWDYPAAELGHLGAFDAYGAYPYHHGLEFAHAYGHPEMMNLNLWSKIKGGAKKVGGAIKKGAASEMKFKQSFSKLNTKPNLKKILKAHFEPTIECPEEITDSKISDEE